MQEKKHYSRCTSCGNPDVEDGAPLCEMCYTLMVQPDGRAALCCECDEIAKTFSGVPLEMPKKLYSPVCRLCDPKFKERDLEFFYTIEQAREKRKQYEQEDLEDAKRFLDED